MSTSARIACRTKLPSLQRFRRTKQEHDDPDERDQNAAVRQVRRDVRRVVQKRRSLILHPAAAATRRRSRRRRLESSTSVTKKPSADHAGCQKDRSDVRDEPGHEQRREQVQPIAQTLGQSRLRPALIRRDARESSGTPDTLMGRRHLSHDLSSLECAVGLACARQLPAAGDTPRAVDRAVRRRGHGRLLTLAFRATRGHTRRRPGVGAGRDLPA